MAILDVDDDIICFWGVYGCLIPIDKQTIRKHITPIKSKVRPKKYDKNLEIINV